MPFYEGGPCVSCGAESACVWYGGADGPNYCHLRGCRRMGGYLSPVGGKRQRSQPDGRGESEEEHGDVCIEIELILGQSSRDPAAILGKVARRNAPEEWGVWYDVLGTFADPAEDNDAGNTDRRFVKLQELLQHIDKKVVKAAIAAYEREASKTSKSIVAGFRRA